MKKKEKIRKIRFWLAKTLSPLIKNEGLYFAIFKAIDDLVLLEKEEK